MAKAMLQVEMEAWHGKRMEGLSTWGLRKSGGITFDVLGKTWMANIPTKGRENFVKRLANLLAFAEQATGQAPGPLCVADVVTAENAMTWVRLRQEYNRRGWQEGAPVDVKNPWAVLRADLAAVEADPMNKELARRMPPIDKRTAAAGNTTIKSYLNCIRSIFGPTGRTEYLRGLEVPPLTDFMEMKIKLPTPKGHRQIETDDYAAMYAAAEQLKASDLQLWVTLMMMWRFGSRPIEVWKARPNWIEMINGEPVFVLSNREEEGFSLKAAERNIERRIRVPADLWEAIQQVQTTEAIIGGTSPTATKNLVERDCSQWVRQFLPKADYGSHSNYMLRHYIGRLVSRRHGSLMASLYLGHSTEATLANRRATITETRYSDGGGSEILPAITWEDVRPE
jgi:hypothetical protein